MQCSSASRAAGAAVDLDRDDLAHRRPTTTRSIPARSRRVSISPKPASRSSSADRGRLPLADLEPDDRGATAGSLRHDRRGSRRGRRGRRAAPRAAPSRGSRAARPGPVALGDVGQVGEDEVEARSPARGTVPARGSGRGRRGRAARRSRAPPRAPRPRCRWRSPRSPAARRRPRARSRPSRCRRRAAAAGRSSSATSTSSSVSGRGISTRRSTASSRWRKPLRPRM